MSRSRRTNEGGGTISSRTRVYEITQFVKMNKLTKTITLSSGVQARVSDKTLVDSLEGTMMWEYDPMACPQRIVQLYTRDF
jgi:hypothetical protein